MKSYRFTCNIFGTISLLRLAFKVLYEAFTNRLPIDVHLRFFIRNNGNVSSPPSCHFVFSWCFLLISLPEIDWYLLWQNCKNYSTASGIALHGMSSSWTNSHCLKSSECNAITIFFLETIITKLKQPVSIRSEVYCFM